MNATVDVAALNARIAELEAKLAAKAVHKPSLKQSKNNPDYWTLFNGLQEKGVHPMTTAHKKVWQLIVANIKDIEAIIK